MKSRFTLASVLLCCAVIGWSLSPARADRLKMKDGSVVEGTILPQGDNYWVKTADGSTKLVPKSQVASLEKGSATAAPAATGTPAGGATAAKPGTAAKPAGAPFLSTKSKADRVDSALAAVTIWQQWIDAAPPDSPDLTTAKAELEKWQKLADSGAEKIKGKWIGGEEREALIEKSNTLAQQAQEMAKNNQLLQAVKKLEEAAATYPNSFEATFTLGYLAMIQHNEDKAIEWLDQALRVDPESPEALSNKGVVLVIKKQYEKGIVLMRKAVDIQDRKEIVQNLITAISDAPPAFQNRKDMKETLGAARLLASKYGISGPATSFTIIPWEPRKKGDKDNSSNPAGMWSGSGFVVSDDGLILTNRHVVAGGKTLMVMLPNLPPVKGKMQQRSAEVVVIDDDQDLALIRIKMDDKLTYVKLAATDAPGDGAECTVMGYPLIDRLGANVKITRGIVSSAAKRLSGPDVVIDAKVNPGNSGGPILDKHGNVMAIVSMKTISSAMEDTYGLGISAGKIRQFLTKNKITLEAGESEGAGLSAEDIATKVKPATVCIIGTK